MVRNIQITILLLMLTFSQLNAQEIYFGVNGGKLHSLKSIEVDTGLPSWMRDSLIWEPIHSYTFGFHIGYRIDGHWSVESGLQFSNEGYRDSSYVFWETFSGNIVSLNIAYFEWQHNYYYMRMPLLAQYSIFKPDTRFGLVLFVGPNFGFLMKQDSRVYSSDRNARTILASANLTDEPIRKTDIGVQGGLRLQAKLKGPLRLFADFSYYQGGKNIIKNPKEYYEYDYRSIKNRHLSGNLGLQVSF